MNLNLVALDLQEFVREVSEFGGLREVFGEKESNQAQMKVPESQGNNEEDARVLVVKKILP